ncbi:hypothetical protein EG829_01770 [bacterium]|nr:hypothetical protein [bacterium]
MAAAATALTTFACLFACDRADIKPAGPPEKVTVADFSGIETGIVRDVWPDTSFTVSLDQSLILAMEDETRWAIQSRLTTAQKVPNYLDFIYFDCLRAVNPEAVRI